MIVGRHKDSTRFDHLLTILLAVLVSLLVNIGWYLQRQEPKPRPVIDKICPHPMTSINNQRPQMPPVFLRDRLP